MVLRIALLALLAAPVATGDDANIVVDALEASGHRLRVVGRAPGFPDGVQLNAYLKLARDPTSQLERRPVVVAAGAFAAEFGPYEAPLFPSTYEVSIHFSPSEQAPGLLDAPAGAIEIARTVEVGRPGESAAAVDETTKAILDLVEAIETLFDEAHARADLVESGRDDRAESVRWLASFRERVAGLRGRYAGMHGRWAHPPFPRVDHEVFVLFNFLIDQRYRTESVLEAQPPNPSPLGAEAFADRVAGARRQLAFDAVRAHPDPAVAIETLWNRPLRARLEVWAAEPGGAPVPERLEAGRFLSQLLDRPELPGEHLARNRWFLSLAEAIDGFASRPPALRSRLARIARSLIDRTPLPVAEVVRELSLASHPAEDFGERIDEALALVEDLFAAIRGAEPDPEEWDTWSTLWDSGALRVLEDLARPIPAALAPHMETPGDLESRRAALTTLVGRLVAEKAILAARVAAGDAVGELVEEEAGWKCDLEALDLR